MEDALDRLQVMEEFGAFDEPHDDEADKSAGRWHKEHIMELKLKIPKRLNKTAARKAFLRSTGQPLTNIRRNPHRPGHWLADHGASLLRGQSLLRLALSHPAVNRQLGEEGDARQQAFYRHEEHVAIQKHQAAERRA
jgi:hypothetical protein